MKVFRRVYGIRAVSAGKWRSSSVDGCRQELLINAYSNKLREHIGASRRSSSWHGPVDCPSDVTSICNMNGDELEASHEKDIQQHRELLPRKLSMRKSLPIDIGSTRIAASFVS